MVEECECIVWREGDLRCELWLVAGESRLRLFGAEGMRHDEPVPPDTGAYYRRALELLEHYQSATGHT